MKYLIAILPFALLSACEQRVINGDDITNGSYATSQAGDASGVIPGDDDVYDEYGRLVSIAPTSTAAGYDSDRIVLSDYSQEQQKRDREEYARQLDVIEANRVDINNVDVPIVNTTVNVAAYARSTTNQLGVSVYSRSGSKGSCRKYSSSVEAQRAFLEKGGPASDPLGLDPDGDGFACAFNPATYRALRF